MRTIVLEHAESTDVLADGGVMVLSPRDGALVHLNRAAAVACRALREHDGNLADAALNVASIFHIDPATARSDIEQLIAQLTRHGLARTIP